MDPLPEQNPTTVVPQIVVERRGRSWRGPLTLLFGLAFVLLLFLGGVVLLGAVATAMGLGEERRVEERYHSLAKDGTDKVAIITVEGAILEGDGFAKKQIDQVRKDENVKAIVLRVNSPGGTVTGSDYILHHLKRLIKERELPIVVSMGGIAASGGYYVSMAVGDTPETIYAEPTTWTGSIGVVIPHYNVAGLVEEWKIVDDSVKSHRLKQMGSPLKAMTEEERTIFQGLVDDSFQRFKQIVLEGRPKLRADPGQLDKVATGQVFPTDAAIKAGLVDREGFIEDAVDRVLELAHLDKERTKVVEYRRPPNLVDIFGVSARADGPAADLATLIELTSPRAYYLCTWLPPLGEE